MNGVRIRAYAKLNLTLDVTGAEGGYHLLDSFVASVSLFDLLVLRKRKDGLVSGSVDLTEPITRLAVAQIAAKAMGLSITNLSSVQPFTDTTDPYVRALNAAGIVGGYFENGTSTYKPYNTLTRRNVNVSATGVRFYGGYERWQDYNLGIINQFELDVPWQAGWTADNGCCIPCYIYGFM